MYQVFSVIWQVSTHARAHTTHTHTTLPFTCHHLLCLCICAEAGLSAPMQCLAVLTSLTLTAFCHTMCLECSLRMSTVLVEPHAPAGLAPLTRCSRNARSVDLFRNAAYLAAWRQRFVVQLRFCCTMCFYHYWM